MFRKLILSAAAIGALGAAALAPTAASAGHWGRHGHHHHHRHHYWQGTPTFAYYGDPCLRKRWVRTPRGPKVRWVNICY